MVANNFRTAGFILAGLALTALPVFADNGHRSHGDRRDSGRAVQSRGDSGRFGRNDVGRARFVAPRFYSPRFIRPRIVNIVPYRPYAYHYRPGFSASFYYGTPYYAPYGYAAPPAGYLNAVPGRLYGGVRITDAPRDAQVFVDGYYMGVVDEFDGVFQHMNLEAGPHHVEVREPGWEPIAFDVNVQPGQTITFRADMDPGQADEQ